MACFTLQQKTHHSSVRPLGQVSCSSCTAEAKPRFFCLFYCYLLYFVFVPVLPCSDTGTGRRQRLTAPVNELFVPPRRVAFGGNATSAPDSSFLLARAHAYSTGQLTSLRAACATLLTLKPEINCSLVVGISSCFFFSFLLYKHLGKWPKIFIRIKKRKRKIHLELVGRSARVREPHGLKASRFLKSGDQLLGFI